MDNNKMLKLYKLTHARTFSKGVWSDSHLLITELKFILKYQKEKFILAKLKLTVMNITVTIFYFIRVKGQEKHSISTYNK